MMMVLDADNKVIPRPVKLGQVVNEGVLIDSGLNPGDRYIIEGLMKARPGAVVKPVSADEMKAITTKVISQSAAK
jgi:membrane fusion protein (multidrug efflux system)